MPTYAPFYLSSPPLSQTKETEKLLADYTAEAKQRSLDGKVLARISEALHSCQVEILPGRVSPYLCCHDN